MTLFYKILFDVLTMLISGMLYTVVDNRLSITRRIKNKFKFSNTKWLLIFCIVIAALSLIQVIFSMGNILYNIFYGVIIIIFLNRKSDLIH